jgi:large subunit ribosomal protein L25
MKYIDLKGVIRENLGKTGSRKVRKEENVPCILYGENTNVYFSVNEKELKEAVYTPHVYLVNLDIDGKKYEAKIQDIQFHPVTDTPIHLDFLLIDKSKKITVELPVRIQGNSVGVREGGKLTQDLRKLKVKGLVKDLPEEIAIDVTELALGKSLRVGDIHLENIELLNVKTNPVVSVRETRQSRGTDAAAAPAAAPAKGAAAPAAAAAPAKAAAAPAKK